MHSSSILRWMERICGTTLYIVIIIILANSMATKSESISEQQQQQHQSSHSLQRCSLYIAPSTIPGAGLGVFTSVAMSDGTVLGAPDVIIPIVDILFHHPDYLIYNSSWMMDDYVWDGPLMMGMHREGYHDSSDGSYYVSAYAPGIDCAVNSVPSVQHQKQLLNIRRMGYPTYDTTTLPHRNKYPSAGSMTAYWNNDTNYAKGNLLAGAELFKDYGPGWFEERNHIVVDDTNTTVPLEGVHGDNGDDSNNENTEGINLLLQKRHIRDNLLDMPDARCFNSIVPGQSTIEGAGRGGFAAWSFQAGQVITGSPLIHIPNKTVLEMYTFVYNDDDATEVAGPPEVCGHQLLLNYCWGHSQTNLLLCPYGAGINLLNHSRERANVKIQWAPDGHIAQNDTWFQISPQDMKMSFRPHLAWDYVALRDIAEGEELFIDYGDDWVTAWEAHVAEWEDTELPPEYAEYMSAAEWNEVNADADIRTVQEQRDNPYPGDIEVVCHPSLNDDTYFEHNQTKSVTLLWPISQDGVACQVLARQQSAADDGETHYTVQLLDKVRNAVLSRERVLRKMFRFRDAEYATDMHMDDVFRKEAAIPEDMLPMAWRTQTASDDEHGEL